MDQYFYLFDPIGNLLHTVKAEKRPKGYKSFSGDALADAEGCVDWTATTYDGSKLAAIPVIIPEIPPVVEKTAEQIAAERKNTLDLMYAAKEKALVFDFSKALISGDTLEAGVYGNDYKNLQALFGDYSAEITAGNDPFVMYGNDAFIIRTDIKL